MTDFDKIAGDLLEFVMGALHDAKAADARVAATVGNYLDELAIARTTEKDGDQ